MILRPLRVLPLLLFGHTVLANNTTAEIDGLLNTMAASDGDVYLRARNALVDLDSAILKARVAQSKWNAETWDVDVAAATAYAWQQERPLCQRAYKLTGLSPAIYSRNRRGVPEVGRELQRLGDVAPVLAEIYTRKVAYPFAETHAYPRHLDPEQQRAKETAALRIGILFALGRSQHPLGPLLFTRVMIDQTTFEPERRAAAIALGETANIAPLSPLPQLTALARDQGASAWLRGGAVIGVAKAGRQNPEESLRELTTLLGQSDLQRSVISGLAILGASSGNGSEKLRSQISSLLITLLTGDLGPQHGAAVAEAIVVVGHDSATAALAELANDPLIPTPVRERVHDAQRILEISLSRKK
ncbi:MAG: hypothetical protein A2289_17710 [Deltaproteobacteria bacterium RIFOXYA12_FULL_58_15]|nr:MAG: hypothetical protein A2289_17710 [Deltaproteobacteria bacterium RIFOXYA12_FULL_58_15]OGR14902.1 MAG: hypothetical protein A2341_18465 [Deltaproteobacteria bacterium RIFOXYB12_FULL_58_9]